jgi:hypothetical protein
MQIYKFFKYILYMIYNLFEKIIKNRQSGFLIIPTLLFLDKGKNLILNYLFFLRYFPLV